jgi:hypothetical protein
MTVTHGRPATRLTHETNVYTWVDERMPSGKLTTKSKSTREDDLLQFNICTWVYLSSHLQAADCVSTGERAGLSNISLSTVGSSV